MPAQLCFLAKKESLKSDWNWKVTHTNDDLLEKTYTNNAAGSAVVTFFLCLSFVFYIYICTCYLATILEIMLSFF